MKIAAKCLVLLASLVVHVCFAGQQTGVVASLVKRNSDGLLYFYISGSAPGKPACATQSYWIIKDENSNSGKQILALLMMARSTGQAITVQGSNTCTRWGDGEDVDSVFL